MPRIKIVAKGKSKAAFDPAEMVIPVEQKVFWLNDDTKKHQVSLTGEILEPGETSSEVVITGDRSYFCMLHEGEKGTIKIKGLIMVAGIHTAKEPQAKGTKAKGAKAKGKSKGTA